MRWTQAQITQAVRLHSANFTYSEIAAQLHTTRDAVAGTLARARGAGAGGGHGHRDTITRTPTHIHHQRGNRTVSYRILSRLFIITDAVNRTVCCDGTMDAVHREAARAHLIAPLSVHDWYRTDKPTPHGGWVKREMFVWPAGAPSVGA